MKGSPVVLAVLALLSEGPLHPYRMQQLIKDRAMEAVVNVRNRSGLHAAITRLVKEGLIRVAETERDGHRPERTMYELTGDGRKAMRAQLHECLAVPAQEFPLFPAAVSLLHLVEPQEALRCLSARAEILGRNREAAVDVIKAAEARGVERLHLLEREHLLAITEAELSWVRGVLSDIEGKRLWWTSR